MSTNNSLILKMVGVFSLIATIVALTSPIYRAIIWPTKTDTRIGMLEERLEMAEKKLEEEKEKSRSRREQIHQELHKYHED